MSISRYAFLSAIGLFVTYVSFRAIQESWDNDGFPEALAIKLELMPFIFPVHMVTGGLALLLVPLTIHLRHTKWHKFAGHIASLDIIIAGITALPVALAYPVTFISGLGFAAQAVTWLTLLGFGIWHIKNSRVKQHYTSMLLMAAVTSGAVFFRVYLGLWKLLGSGKYFYTFYAIDAWIAWSIPLLAMWFYLRISHSPQRARH